LHRVFGVGPLGRHSKRMGLLRENKPLLLLAGAAMSQGKVVQAGERVGMVRTEAGFPSRPDLLEHRQRFMRSSSHTVCVWQGAHGPKGERMIRTEHCYSSLPRLGEDRDGVVVVAQPELRGAQSVLKSGDDQRIARQVIELSSCFIQPLTQ